MIFGDYRIEIIADTEFRLDGGAMFGVVPRLLWEKKCPPDEFNRIKMNMNCLFIETKDEKILIETGIGEKWTEKQTQMYGIFRRQSFAQSLWEKTGYSPEEITLVVNTHLHFDHAGGNTILDTEGKAVPQFPNAHYYVSRSEFDQAENAHERHRASYLKENWRPLIENGQLHLKPDNYQVVEGLTMETIRGHSETMQCVRLTQNGQTLFSFADLIPTRHHLPIAWIMGYDLFPVETLEAKKKLLPQAVRENWLCFFYHDFEFPLCRLVEVEGKLQAVNYEG